MGDKTKIEWTDATWNPIRGCSRVSEGCSWNRSLNPEWARDIRDQCARAGVACFVKQMGAVYSRANGGDAHGSDCIPDDLRVREFPKEA